MVVDSPLAYTFGNPAVKRVLYALEELGGSPYEELRQDLGVAPQAFHRMTRRLAQFDLVRLRAAREAEFENGRIRLVVEASPKGLRLTRVLHELDDVVRRNEDAVGHDAAERVYA